MSENLLPLMVVSSTSPARQLVLCKLKAGLRPQFRLILTATVIERQAHRPVDRREAPVDAVLVFGPGAPPLKLYGVSS